MPLINEFQSEGVRKLPEPKTIIKIKASFKSSCIQELDFYEYRIQKKEKLLPFEKVKYAALTKFLKPETFDEKFKQEYIKEE